MYIFFVKSGSQNKYFTELCLDSALVSSFLVFRVRRAYFCFIKMFVAII